MGGCADRVVEKGGMALKKVLIQGAMDIEADYFIKQVSEAPDYKVVEEDGFVFHCGTFANKYYIVNQTGMGTVKAAMATTYGIMRFHPTVVINQGTAGAQNKELHSGDLIQVVKAVNINALSMPKKEAGEGSDPFSWEGFHTAYYESDEALLELCAKVEYTYGRIVKGNVSTGDIFSRETDRIVWLSEYFHTCCEDMETVAVFEVCEKMGTPCVGLRIISNNEIKGEEFNPDTARYLQEYIWKVVYHWL